MFCLGCFERNKRYRPMATASYAYLNSKCSTACMAPSESNKNAIRQRLIACIIGVKARQVIIIQVKRSATSISYVAYTLGYVDRQSVIIRHNIGDTVMDSPPNTLKVSYLILINHVT